MHNPILSSFHHPILSSFHHPILSSFIIRAWNHSPLTQPFTESPFSTQVGRHLGTPDLNPWLTQAAARMGCWSFGSLVVVVLMAGGGGGISCGSSSYCRCCCCRGPSRPSWKACHWISRQCTQMGSAELVASLELLCNPWVENTRSYPWHKYRNHDVWGVPLDECKSI